MHNAIKKIYYWPVQKIVRINGLSLNRFPLYKILNS